MILKYTLFFICSFTQAQTLVSIQPDFNYGVSDQAQRIMNWMLFKNLCDYHKKINGTINLGKGRIELYHADKEKISMIAGEKLNLILGGELVFYPFVPRPGYNYVFDMAYGSELSITGGKVKVAQRGNLFESYRCDFNRRTITVLGAIRKGFWDELAVGKVIYCSWNNRTLGKASTIVTWNKVAETLTVADDLAVTSPTDPWIGFDFTEGVSEYSYNIYGQHWVKWEYNEPRTFTFINHGPPTATGPDAVINLSSTKIENWKYPIAISSGAFKVNLKGTVEINNSEIALSVFARSQLNHQSILGPTATLILRNNGLNSVGSIDVISAGNIWGSGAYIHPTVIVQIDKFRGYNNAASTFRQYSSSIEVVCPKDYVSWINDFQCEGSGEEDLKTSNCMPVEIGYFKGGNLLTIGGSLNIKSGTIGRINLTSLLHPSDNAETKIQINNATISGQTTMGWEKGAAEFTDIEFNKCKWIAGVAFVPNQDNTNAVEEMIKNDGTGIRSIAINNCEYRKGKGPIASSLIRCVRFLKVNIEGMVTDTMPGAFLMHNAEQKIPPNDKVIIHIDHSSINMGLMDPKNFLPGQVQGIETTVPSWNLSGNWSVPI